MSLLDAIRHRLRTALAPDAADRERAEEYAFHETIDAAHRVHGGTAPGEARFAARREFGNATYLREQARWMGAARWLDAVRQDLRYGWRALRRAPVFTGVAVASLALGIGANAVIFGTIQALLIAQLPVTRPEELRLVTHSPDGTLRSFFSGAEVAALRPAFGVDVATIRPAGASRVAVDGVPIDPLSIDAVDGAFFRVLGAGLMVGRPINATDDSAAAPVAVLSHRFAAAHFPRPEAALGRTVKLNDIAFTVVGVTRAGYEGISTGHDYAVAVPAGTLPLLQGAAAREQSLTAFIIARLDVDSTRTRSALEAAFQQCCASGALAGGGRGAPAGDRRIGFVDLSRGTSEGKKGDVRAQYGTALLALMGGVAVLLLIACTNVGNLLMARATARTRELAVRLSLGASRGRIVRQLLVESLLLAALGGVAGFVVALWGSAVLSRNLPVGLGALSGFIAVRPGLQIVAFTAAVAVACAVLFGVVPAFRATRGDLVAGLRQVRAGRPARAIDRGLVAAQVALALLLVSSAGLLVATLKHLSDSVGGSNPETLLVVQLDARGTPHSDTALQLAVPALERRFRALPGVKSVAESYVVPLIYGGLPTRMLDVAGFESVADPQVEVAAFNVSPGYFGTLGVKLIGGRDFDDRDVRGAQPVAIVSENVALQFFAGRNPIGQMIGFREGPRSLQVIGVVGDAKQTNLRAPAERTIYLPSAQSPREDFGDRAVFAVRTSVPAAQVVPATRAAILAELPSIRIRHVHPMVDLLSLTISREKTLAWLSVAFGVLAVLLAAVGLYGVMAFQVSARTREIGVRMALGASRGQVVRMVLGQALALVTVGVALGMPLAVLGARSLRALLYGVTPYDAVPLVLGGSALVAVGLLASLVPSGKAARVDPLIAIRAE